jgi:hypothetical protein
VRLSVTRVFSTYDIGGRMGVDTISI